MENLQFPQEYEDAGIIILDDLNGKETNDVQVQAKFERSRHDKLSFFINNQDYYEIRNERLEVMETSTNTQNQTISETFKISIKIKPLWI